MSKVSVIYGLALTAIAAIALTGMTDSYVYDNHLLKSAGAPLGSTNAPGEVSCAVAGCHDSFSINSGPGMIGLTVDTGVTSYRPDSTYQVFVSLNQPGFDKFGFQAVVLRDSDNMNSGQISLVNGIRTQMYANEDSASSQFGRNYISHTVEGNVALTPGWGEWSFVWTAPSDNVGDITIYLACVAANQNGNEFGDDVYGASLTLAPDSSLLSGLPPRDNHEGVFVFPNPARRNVPLYVKLPTNGPVPDELRITIVDVNGRPVITSILETGQAGKGKMPVYGLKPGLYFYRIVSEGKALNAAKLLIL